jgi:hypothetical protein
MTPATQYHSAQIENVAVRGPMREGDEPLVTRVLPILRLLDVAVRPQIKTDNSTYDKAEPIG